MPNIKVSLSTPHSSFTKMRVYRAPSLVDAFNESYFIEEVAPAAEYIDRSNGRSPTVERYWYGFRFQTASGFTWDAAPVMVQNRYDLDYLNCESLDHPFLSGNSVCGLYQLNNINDVIPDRTQVQNLIKAKFPGVGFSSLNIASSTVCGILSINGRLIVGGLAYGTIASSSIGQAVGNINTLKAALVDVTPDSSYILTKNGFRWRLCMLSREELAMTGRYSAPSLQNGPYVMNGLTVSNHMTLTYWATAGYLTWCGSSLLSTNGNWNTQVTNVVTGIPSNAAPAVTMEFIGRE